LTAELVNTLIERELPVERRPKVLASPLGSMFSLLA
jgi:hypothetical protein